MEISNKLRVAVYIRIGGTGEYKSTLESQKRYFSETVGKNPEWELVDFYADVGSDSRKQPAMKRMLADCESGRIDLIITKSVARFSRNLAEVMKIVRDLRYLKNPVGVLFEQENLNTIANDSLIFLSTVEAMAIQESEAKHDSLPYIFLAKYTKPGAKPRKPKKAKEVAVDEQKNRAD